MADVTERDWQAATELVEAWLHTNHEHRTPHLRDRIAGALAAAREEGRSAEGNAAAVRFQHLTKERNDVRAALAATQAALCEARDKARRGPVCAVCGEPATAYVYHVEDMRLCGNCQRDWKSDGAGVSYYEWLAGARKRHEEAKAKAAKPCAVCDAPGPHRRGWGEWALCEADWRAWLQQPSGTDFHEWCCVTKAAVKDVKPQPGEGYRALRCCCTCGHEECRYWHEKWLDKRLSHDCPAWEAKP